jgi:hypothetical protein
VDEPEGIAVRAVADPLSAISSTSVNDMASIVTSFEAATGKV